MPQIIEPASPLISKLHGIHLFHFEGAPCAQRVRMALAEKGVKRGREARWNSYKPDDLKGKEGTWTSRHVSLIKKDHFTPEYAAIQPNLVVPALVHDGKLYIESMDIVKYLDEVLPGSPLIPEEIKLAEEAQTLVDLGKKLHVSVRYVSFRWGLGRIARLNKKQMNKLEKLEMKNSPEHLVSFYDGYSNNQIHEKVFLQHLKDLEEGYQVINQKLIENQSPYLVGSHYSIADIIWSFCVHRIHECGYPFATNFPAIYEWYQQVSQRPSFQEVMIKNRLMSKAFLLKAQIENFLGIGIKKFACNKA